MSTHTTKFATNATAEQPMPESGRARAFVTFLAGNGDYVKGVVSLAKGLRKVKTMYPLHSQGCLVREIEPVHPPENQTKFARDYFFVEYSKMIYLDADIQVFGNIDHLFDLSDNYFYAVLDCFCEKSWSNTPQYKIGYCPQCPDKVQWPSEFGAKPLLGLLFY
ncbi:galactinol synthase 2-like [Gastrolobium bilobum]|uniref:galactinol synthase 2-like n=1 Tax=Gastrolobium bilobum TaxID=150636 RepID=UPI002AB288EE|nr:galactinol synthase 2-like [Gastrolobium bilobum]